MEFHLKMVKLSFEIFGMKAKILEFHFEMVKLYFLDKGKNIIFFFNGQTIFKTLFEIDAKSFLLPSFYILLFISTEV